MGVVVSGFWNSSARLTNVIMVLLSDAVLTRTSAQYLQGTRTTNLRSNELTKRPQYVLYPQRPAGRIHGRPISLLDGAVRRTSFEARQYREHRPSGARPEGGPIRCRHILGVLKTVLRTHHLRRNHGQTPLNGLFIEPFRHPSLAIFDVDKRHEVLRWASPTLNVSLHGASRDEWEASM